MNHTEAVEQFAAERYLLDELTPDVREAFEAHYFDCSECATDLRASALFLDEAKAELPSLPDPAPSRAETPKSKTNSWLAWLRPAFVMPAFAALIGVVIFQNVVTFPALRDQADQPRLIPLNRLRPATRGSGHTTIAVDRQHGAALQVDFAETNEVSAQAYSIELVDSRQKAVWTTTTPAGAHASDQDQQFSLYLPGAKLSNGAYLLKITGVDAQGQRTPVDQYPFDIVVSGQ